MARRGLSRQTAQVGHNMRIDGTYSNLRVTSSETALEAYRKGVGDSFWVDRPTYR